MSAFKNIRSKLASIRKPKSTELDKVYYDLDDDEDYAPVGIPGLLASSEKLLGINQGLAEEDERDSWAFKRIYGPDRLMRLRVKMDAGPGGVNILKGLARRVSRTKNLNSVVPGTFNGYLEGAILGNPLSLPLEETNPLNLVTQHRRVTHMGPGGINSSDAITSSMQSVHPSQFSFISLIEGPECFSEELGNQVFTKRGWVSWVDVKDDDIFACLVEGSLAWELPTSVTREYYEGSLHKIKQPGISLSVTPTHGVWCDTVKGPRKIRAEDACAEKIQIPTKPDPTIKDISINQEDALGCITVTPDMWSTSEYTGMVYCATVPGGLLYVRGDTSEHGHWSGNSEKIGVDARFAWGTKLGSDGRIYSSMIDRRTGKRKWVSPWDLRGKTIKIPE